MEQLKDLPDTKSPRALTEWDIYSLVVDQLMLRDLRQAGHVLPNKRRAFLQSLAFWLSQKEHSVLDETQFRELIGKEFRQELQRYDSSQRQVETENLFEDLRRSGTLTRSVDATRSGWRFSHDSLREFLLAERLLEALDNASPILDIVPVSDAMRIFRQVTVSRSTHGLAGRLAEVWASRQNNSGVGQLLSLLWDGLLTLTDGKLAHEVLAILRTGVPALDSVSLSRLVLSTVNKPAQLNKVNFSDSELTDVKLEAAALSGSSFNDSFLDNVDFADADLTGATFTNSVVVDAVFSRSLLLNADFRATSRVINPRRNERGRSSSPEDGGCGGARVPAVLRGSDRFGQQPLGAT